MMAMESEDPRHGNAIVSVLGVDYRDPPEVGGWPADVSKPLSANTQIARQGLEGDALVGRQISGYQQSVGLHCLRRNRNSAFSPVGHGTKTYLASTQLHNTRELVKAEHA